jgi:hypothetical protein
MNTRTTVLCALAAVPCSAPLANAALITFQGPSDQNGTGFGNILNVLSLQRRPEESGAIIRQNNADTLLGDATNQSQTRSVAELLQSGADPANLGVIFNINDPGVAPMVTIHQFDLLFFDAAGTLLFTAPYSGTLTLAPVNMGTGGSGYLFDVDLSPAELTFFNDPTNRIGLRVTTPIQSTAGGPENFYLIPTPGSFALLATAAIFARRRARR